MKTYKKPFVGNPGSVISWLPVIAAVLPVAATVATALNKRSIDDEEISALSSVKRS